MMAVGAPDQCICGQVIPDTAIYYGFELDPDNDAPLAFINEWHGDCLREWGWMRDDSEWGITHRIECDVVPIPLDELHLYLVTDDDEDIRPS